MQGEFASISVEWPVPENCDMLEIPSRTITSKSQLD